MTKIVAIVFASFVLVGCFNTYQSEKSAKGVSGYVIEKCLDGFLMLEYSAPHRGSLIYKLNEDGKPIKCDLQAQNFEYGL